MDNILLMQVPHSVGHLLRPVDENLRTNGSTIVEHFEQLTLRTVFHDNTITRRLGAHTSEKQRLALAHILWALFQPKPCPALRGNKLLPKYNYCYTYKLQVPA